jgi:hypothetical protein
MTVCTLAVLALLAALWLAARRPQALGSKCSTCWLLVGKSAR